MEQDKILEKLINEQSSLTSELRSHNNIVENDGSVEIPSDSFKALLIGLKQRLQANELQVIEAQIEEHTENPMATLCPISFGVAVEALKMGWPIARDKWVGPYGCMWVIHQVPSNIDGTIIPKMQSLPTMAKKRIMRTTAQISYNNQCLIYDETTGTANSWTPSIDDIMAEDWFVVNS